MDTLRTRAEIEKTAHFLDVGPDRLAFLAALPAADVRRFREQVTASLFDDQPDMLDRIAKATKLVPTSIAATISQKALGAKLAARVAGRLEPARAADIVEKLPIGFTAESCGHLDPRRVRDLVERLPEDLVVKIGVVLATRADFVTMGRFVGHLSDAAIGRILGQVGDDVVLRVGFFVDMPERLDHIVGLMDTEKLASVIRAASTESLWAEALAVASMVGDARRAEIARLTARQDGEQLDALVRAVHREHLWEALLPLVALLDGDDRRAVAVLPSLQSPEVLGDVVRAVVATGLWSDFLPLVDVLPEKSRQLVAEAAGTLDDADLDRMASAVQEQDLWEAVIPLVELMDDAAKERVFALEAFQDFDGDPDSNNSDGDSGISSKDGSAK
ncbi:hypothetical protein [Yinghuangia soli]|uniref:Uncharacterized protein n=1 Tax=Yinghuangia soli TaxID=2908204 RepID=A0AA41TY19_9ACTN|nr:hypothetical protein [Yinghuangia soli]MCF2525916.1 hypothetical protein [Yinghuangia soli]